MIDIAHSLTINFASSVSSIDIATMHPGHLHLGYFDLDWDFLLAQAQKSGEFKQDVVSDMTKGWNNFVKTGQIWALLVGLTLGYLFRSVTSS
ncbi:MAG: hypothetical protein HC935_09350 [Pseudanabaena sp. SU_2_4]|nr:hypothetical protein [Pseudanabaena sp. SU_2_4]